MQPAHDGQGSLAQRHDMLDAYLHAPGRDGPKRPAEIEFGEGRAERLAGPRRRLSA
jgi:hypothetical protein